MNNNENSMYNVKEDGFVTESYWQKSIHLMTIDDEGNAVDCYDKVVDELKDKESNVVSYYKKEERKNKLINFIYNLQKKMLITSISLLVFTFLMYIVFVILGKIDIIYSARDFIKEHTYAPLYKKICHVVEPVNVAIVSFITKHGFENLFNYTLTFLLVASVVCLIVFMISRDHITLRWVSKLTRIKPLCKIKEDSDRRVTRLKSDLYNLQLRQHKVKYTTHDK